MPSCDTLAVQYVMKEMIDSYSRFAGQSSIGHVFSLPEHIGCGRQVIAGASSTTREENAGAERQIKRTGMKPNEKMRSGK